MRILITGASGFIGSNLFERLARKNVCVAGVVRANNQSASSEKRIAHLDQLVQAHPNACILRCPDFGGLTKLFAEFSPTTCVHLAGRSSVRESFHNPGMYAEANGAGVIDVLEAARGTHCRRVVHASSVMIYGKDAPLPYNEVHIGSTPASFYGASKLAAEILLNAWRALHGIEVVNLRLFSVYGPDLRPDSVPHLIASAIREEREFTVFGDGSSVRDYVEIDDVLNAIEAAIAAPWTSDFPRALNIGSGVGTPLLDLVRLIERGLNKKGRLVHKPAVAGELHAIVADIAEAERILKWKAQIGLHDGIARLTDWFNAHA